MPYAHEFVTVYLLICAN